MSSCQRDDKSLLKGAWFCSREPFFCIHNCGLRKKFSTASMNCEQQVVEDGLLLIAPTAVEATLRLRSKLHRFDLSLYLLQSWLYNI